MEITDFFLACYLIAEGQEIERVAIGRAGSKGKERFLFRPSEQLSDLIANYESDRARVSPRRFASAIMALRQLIAQARGM